MSDLAQRLRKECTEPSDVCGIGACPNNEEREEAADTLDALLAENKSLRAFKIQADITIAEMIEETKDADTLAAVREAASFYRSCALGRETIRPEVDAKFLAVIDRSDTDE